ncbi:MAG: hypothetical protein KDB07_13010, partial [Planctomycetes bacterium]|nr:hypothetical protein [Planctomycetota bacterium]
MSYAVLRTMTIIAAALLTLLASSCGGDNPDPDPEMLGLAPGGTQLYYTIRTYFRTQLYRLDLRSGKSTPLYLFADCFNFPKMFTFNTRVPLISTCSPGASTTFISYADNTARYNAIKIDGRAFPLRLSPSGRYLWLVGKDLSSH